MAVRGGSVGGDAASARGAGAVVLGLLFKFYAAAPAMIGLVLVLFLFWTRSTGATTDSGLPPIGHGETAPPHWEVERPPSWWAMVFTLAADATLFSALLFGALFLWLVAPNWPPTAIGRIDWMLALPTIMALGAAAVAGRFAARSLAAGGTPVARLRDGEGRVTVSGTEETAVVGGRARRGRGTVRIGPGMGGPGPRGAVAGSGGRLA